VTARGDDDEDFAKRRLAAMMAARHAILALRLDRDVPDLATAHGVEVTVGCVVDDLGRIADVIKDFFHDDVPALVDSRERAIRWAVTLEGQNAAMEAAIRTELATHYRNEALGFGYCGMCEPHDCNNGGDVCPDANSWPCDTVRVLRAALTGSTE
jgi:hypothetical protein